MREAFHDAFNAAMGGDAAALGAWTDAPDLAVRLSVYRNTAAKGCADALVAQFPTVGTVVGEAWLGAAALAYARENPPGEASLILYGAGFSAWLAAFPPAAQMPYLADLAALDFLWAEAYTAADAAPLAPGALQALAPDDFARVRLALHPATRFAGFETGVPSLWRALQADPPPQAFELSDQAEALVFLRPGLDVDSVVLSPGTFALLDACRAGASLADAAMAALAAEPGLALDRAFAELLAGGAFTALISLEPR